MRAPHATNGLYTDAAREVPGVCSRRVVVDKMLTTFKMRFDEATTRPDTCGDLQKVLAPTGTSEPVIFGLTIGKSRMDLTVPAFACAAPCLEQIGIDREPDDCRRIVAVDDQ